MDFKNIASGDLHYDIDRDVEEVIYKYQPVFTEYSIMAEYNLLRDQVKAIQDVYVIPSAKDPLHWFGLIFLRSGCYSGAVLRFHIFIGKNFPQTDIPNIVFAPPVFHPKVDPISGQMETRASFGKWQTGFHHIWHLLAYIKRSFLAIDHTDPLNQIAADLYVHDNVEFQVKVTESITECKERLEEPNQFSSDPHYLTISPYNPNIHGTFRKAVLANGKTSNGSSLGSTSNKPLSWVKPGSLEPCSSLQN